MQYITIFFIITIFASIACGMSNDINNCPRLKYSNFDNTKQSQCEYNIAQQNGILCDGCQIIVSSVEDWIVGNETINTITHYLDMICYLIKIYNSTCVKLINTGVPTLIRLVEKYETPIVICTQINAC